jgi:hypothetical protein
MVALHLSLLAVDSKANLVALGILDFLMVLSVDSSAYNCHKSAFCARLLSVFGYPCLTAELSLLPGDV